MTEQDSAFSDPTNNEASDADNAIQAGVEDLGVQDSAVQQPLPPTDLVVADPVKWPVELPVTPPVAAPVVEQALPQVVQPPVKTDPVVELKQPEAAVGFAALIQNIKTEGTPEQKRMILGIEQYMERMTPGLSMDFNDGARHQHMLWKLLQGVIERAPQEQFKRMWSIILGYFEQHKDGVFGDRYIYRFSEYWHQGEAELAAFQRIINVIRLTSNAEERAKGLRQVDLSRSLEQGFSEQGRQRVVGFYQQ